MRDYIATCTAHFSCVRIFRVAYATGRQKSGKCTDTPKFRILVKELRILVVYKQELIFCLLDCVASSAKWRERLSLILTTHVGILPARMVMVITNRHTVMHFIVRLWRFLHQLRSLCKKTNPGEVLHLE